MTQRLCAATLVVMSFIFVAGSAPANSTIAHGRAAGAVSTQSHGYGVIQHIVVIVQENRSLDNLFQEFNAVYPGAGLDVQSFGNNSHGRPITLRKVSLNANFDLGHSHRNWLIEYNRGEMNGWDREKALCKQSCHDATPFAYIPKEETKPYYTLAHNFAIADHVLQPNQGPSFPAHQYLIAGQAGGFTSGYSERDNPRTRPKKARTGGCNIRHAKVPTIDVRSGARGPDIFPCEDYSPYTTILQEMDAAYPEGDNWRYFTPTIGNIWNAPAGVRSLYYNPLDMGKDSVPETGVFDAITNGTLPKLTYVMPCKANSDHPKSGSSAGPQWVASVTNAIGQSSYWDSTAIVVVWDDWGGWFDHYTPTIRSEYENGFRVPMLVISPWLKHAGIVDHTRRDSTSILRFIESVFHLGSLGTLDRYNDDLSSLFDFGPKHHMVPYTPISTHGFDPYACDKHHRNEPVDDD